MVKQRRFLGYEASRSVPNIVVDGSPNEATVLTITHWPGFAQPPGIAADTSAEMAFAHLDAPSDHEPAEVVTNNHYDQDGAVGIFVLTDPTAAMAHRDLLVDLAEAGDFGTYRFRDAARASMILNGFADPARSPIADRLTGDGNADTVALYEAILPQLVDIVTDPSRHRQLWVAEDGELSASEQAITDGWIEIVEHPDLDLAVVRVDGGQPARHGHRFGFMKAGPVHPMAVHNSTSRSRILTMHGRRYSYVDRYETWVQFRSRSPAPRVDMRPLAERLTAAEHGTVEWRAGPPSALSPTLGHEAESSLDDEAVLAAIRHHLETAAPAWDPFALT